MRTDDHSMACRSQRPAWASIKRRHVQHLLRWARRVRMSSGRIPALVGNSVVADTNELKLPYEVCGGVFRDGPAQ